MKPPGPEDRNVSLIIHPYRYGTEAGYHNKMQDNPAFRMLLSMLAHEILESMQHESIQHADNPIELLMEYLQDAGLPPREQPLAAATETDQA